MKKVLRQRVASGLLLTQFLLTPIDLVRAQVMEIGTGGVIIHDRPEVIGTDSASPITVAKTHNRMANRTVGARPDPNAQRFLSLAATQAELSPDLVEAVAWRESRLHAGAVSPKGAIGEMQLMPATAQTLGVNPLNSEQNYRGGAAYLRTLLGRYDGDVVRALAAYNAGPRAVDRYRGVPPFKETRDYVSDILNHLSERAVGASAPVKR